jgi:hypothetical protein
MTAASGLAASGLAASGLAASGLAAAAVVPLVAAGRTATSPGGAAAASR